MADHRHIRETAFQILVYEAGIHPDQMTGESRDYFWESVSEFDRLRVALKTKSALRHIQTLRFPLLSQFRDFQQFVHQLLRPGEIGRFLFTTANEVATIEQNWIALCEELLPEVNQLIPSGYSASQNEMLAELFQVDRELDSIRLRFLQLKNLHPNFEHLLKDVVSSITELQRISDKVRGFSEAEVPSSQYKATIVQLLKNRQSYPNSNSYLPASIDRLLSSRKGRNVELLERIDRSSAVLYPKNEVNDIADLFSSMCEKEDSLDHLIGILESTRHDGDPDRVSDLLESATSRYFDVDEQLFQVRHRFLEIIQDYPLHRELLGKFTSLLAKLQSISERAQQLKNLDGNPKHKDLKILKAAKQRLPKLRREADAIADAVLRERDNIDERLAVVVENFAPERVDVVDRAILRLGTYELLHAKTPPKIVMNECIELAKRFGTTDSGRFVNGVLDKIAKQAVEQSAK